MNHYKDQGWLALIHFLQWCFTTYIVWQVQLQGWQKHFSFGQANIVQELCTYADESSISWPEVMSYMQRLWNSRLSPQVVKCFDGSLVHCVQSMHL